MNWLQLSNCEKGKFWQNELQLLIYATCDFHIFFLQKRSKMSFLAPKKKIMRRKELNSSTRYLVLFPCFQNQLLRVKVRVFWLRIKVSVLLLLKYFVNSSQIIILNCKNWFISIANKIFRKEQNGDSFRVKPTLAFTLSKRFYLIF